MNIWNLETCFFKCLNCSLGAQHDGDEVVNGVTCSADTQNVMTPSFNSQGDSYLNVYMFSQCSINYFTNKISSLNRYLVKELVWFSKHYIHLYLYICSYVNLKRKKSLEIIFSKKCRKQLFNQRSDLVRWDWISIITSHSSWTKIHTEQLVCSDAWSRICVLRGKCAKLCHDTSFLEL